MIIHGDAKVVFAAYVKARAEIGATVSKDGQGNYGKYATLAALTEATSAPLAEHGCTIVQVPDFSEEGATIATFLLHESGGYIEFTPLTLPVAQRNAQAVGSAISYARRYALAAVCGIAPDDDDDGEAATQTARKPLQRPLNPQQERIAKQRIRMADGKPPAQEDDPFADKEHERQTAKDPPRASVAMLKKLHALGTQAYGKDWDAKRLELVASVSKGAIQSSTDLSVKEASELISGIERKLAQMAAEVQSNGVAKAHA